MLPVDIVDFMQVVSTLGGDLVMCLIVAALKEPLATAKFLELVNAGENPLLRRADYTGEEIGKVLEKVAQCLDGCPNKAEVQQLSRQGVARFVGPASTIRNLGVIAVTTTSPEKQNSTGEHLSRHRSDDDGKNSSVPSAKKKRKGAKDADGETARVASQGCGPPIMRLGITKREYMFTHDYAALQKFIEVCRGSDVQQVWPVMSLLSLSRAGRHVSKGHVLGKSVSRAMMILTPIQG
jgi:hypothetical protein